MLLLLWCCIFHDKLAQLITYSVKHFVTDKFAHLPK
jgi:hypothetical protein